MQIACRRSDLRVVQDGGEAARQLPRLEERRPVDVLDQVGEREVAERRDPGRARLGRRGRVPVDDQAALASLLHRDASRVALGAAIADLGVLLARAREERLAAVVAQERRRDADRPARIRDVHDRSLALRCDAQRGVRLARRRAADQERRRDLLALELGRDVRHLLEARRDQPREADQVGVLASRRLDDVGAGRHHPEIDDPVVVAGEHDADDVLADVVDVALDGRHHDRALGSVLAARVALGLDERHEVRNGLLHHARALDHLRQEHAAVLEAIADHCHAAHQRPLDHLDRPRVGLSRLLGVGDDEVGDALDERVDETVVDGQRPPLLCVDGHHRPGLDARGGLEQAVGRVGAAVQHEVLDDLAQIERDVVVQHQRGRVHDRHVEPGVDRVVEEHRVDRLAHGGMAAEREAQVREAARHERAGTGVVQQTGRLDERDPVAVVLRHARPDRRGCTGRG